VGRTVEDDALSNASITAATMLGMSSFVNGTSVRHRFPCQGEVELSTGGVFLLLLRFVGQEGVEGLLFIAPLLGHRFVYNNNSFSYTAQAYFNTVTMWYCACVVLNSAPLSQPCVPWSHAIIYLAIVLTLTTFNILNFVNRPKVGIKLLKISYVRILFLVSLLFAAVINPYLVF